LGDHFTHGWTWKNETSETAHDLHVEFDIEGVEYKKGRRGWNDSGPDKENKKVIVLKGGEVPANHINHNDFESDDGNFKVVKWYWTDKEGGKLGEEHDGPPQESD
jgi:hypothetical protein